MRMSRVWFGIQRHREFRKALTRFEYRVGSDYYDDLGTDFSIGIGIIPFQDRSSFLVILSTAGS